MAAYGGEFSNGLTEFNAGGSHEENPNGGVMQGIGQNGQPNLVEENETKHGDYVFSDRLKLTKEMVEQNNLPKNLVNKTFAYASKSLSKEAKEKPNDPIQKNTTKAYLSKLTSIQDTLKSKMEEKAKIEQSDAESNNQINQLGLGESMFASGGEIHIKSENVGKFTASAKRAGMDVQEYAHHVMENSKNSTLRKRANFAINAAK